jgi:hypothetical protein
MGEVSVFYCASFFLFFATSPRIGAAAWLGAHLKFIARISHSPSSFKNLHGNCKLSSSNSGAPPIFKPGQSMFKFFLKSSKKPSVFVPSPRCLSSEELDSVTAPGAVADEVPDDRRAQVRIAVGTRALMRSARPDAPTFSVLLRDLSVSGVGLLADHPLSHEEPNWIYIPKLKGCESDSHISSACHVQRCNPGGISRSSFIVAVTFVQGETPALPMLPPPPAPAPKPAPDQSRPRSLFVP